MRLLKALWQDSVVNGWVAFANSFQVKPNYRVAVVLWCCCVVFGVVTIFRKNQTGATYPTQATHPDKYNSNFE